MKSITNMIQGIGIYFNSTQDALPSFDECKDMIAARAYEKWVAAGGELGHDLDFWLEAEHELFCGLDGDGYDVFVCDLAQSQNQGFFRYWDRIHVTPCGVTQL